MTLHDILAIAADAYAAESGGLTQLPKTYEDARQHTSGDTLADFLVIELTEALRSEPHAMLHHRAVDVLLSARTQIDAVIHAIQNATSSSSGDHATR